MLWIFIKKLKSLWLIILVILSLIGYITLVIFLCRTFTAMAAFIFFCSVFCPIFLIAIITYIYEQGLDYIKDRWREAKIELQSNITDQPLTPKIEDAVLPISSSKSNKIRLRK
jgi:predicted membrane protein